jgi:hypothetical protein
MDASSKKIWKKIQNASQKILIIFFVSEVFNKKCHFQGALDDNLNLIHVFIKQIIRTTEQAFPHPLTPPSPLDGYARSGE